MEVGDWITLAAVIVALGIGVASIVVTLIIRAKDITENRHIREEDRELNFKFRLLDEVRDWAREAVKLGFLYERARNSLEARSIFEDMVEDVSKTTDITDMAAKIFKNELEAPVIKALYFVKSYKDPSKFASKEYFDSLFEFLKAVNEVKRKLLSLEK
jgi:hypothetical protein